MIDSVVSVYSDGDGGDVRLDDRTRSEAERFFRHMAQSVSDSCEQGDHLCCHDADAGIYVVDVGASMGGRVRIIWFYVRVSVRDE